MVWCGLVQLRFSTGLFRDPTPGEIFLTNVFSQDWEVAWCSNLVGGCGFIQLKICYGIPGWGFSGPSGPHPRGNGYFSNLGGYTVLQFSGWDLFHPTYNFYGIFRSPGVVVATYDCGTQYSRNPGNQSPSYDILGVTMQAFKRSYFSYSILLFDLPPTYPTFFSKSPTFSYFLSNNSNKLCKAIIYD